MTPSATGSNGGLGSSAVSKIRKRIRRERTRGDGTAYKMVQSLMGQI